MAEQDFPGSVTRACLNCRIVKPFEEFFNKGCPNCEKFMKFKSNFERIVHCTTTSFRDICILSEGYSNWPTRVRPVESFVFGMYANHVFGVIPYRFVYELQSEEKDAESGEYCL